MVTLLYRTLRWTLGDLAHVGNGCKQQLCIKIAAKSLPMETWLLLTAYENSSLSYPTIADPLRRMDWLQYMRYRETTDKETTDTLYPRSDLTVGQSKLLMQREKKTKNW